MNILRDLQKLKLTVVDLLLFVIVGSEGFEGFCKALFSPKNRSLLVGLLEKLTQDKKGRAIVSEWMFPHTLHLVCEKIHAEMEAAKPYLWMNTHDVCPEFIEQWDIHCIMGPVASDTTPPLRTILEAAGQSRVSKAKPKSPKSKNHVTALLVIMEQVHFLCSRNSAKVPIGLGLQAWACGTLRQMINVLH